MSKKEVYPMYKKVLWAFTRTFLASFIVVMSTTLESITSEQLTDLDYWRVVVLVPSIIAGISAMAKYTREYFGADDYSNPIHKLPV